MAKHETPTPKHVVVEVPATLPVDATLERCIHPQGAPSQTPLGAFLKQRVASAHSLYSHADAMQGGPLFTMLGHVRFARAPSIRAAEKSGAAALKQIRAARDLLKELPGCKPLQRWSADDRARLAALWRGQVEQLARQAEKYLDAPTSKAAPGEGERYAEPFDRLARLPDWVVVKPLSEAAKRLCDKYRDYAKRVP